MTEIQPGDFISDKGFRLNLGIVEGECYVGKALAYRIRLGNGQESIVFADDAQKLGFAFAQSLRENDTEQAA